MYKDTQEELKRLEEALLEEETALLEERQESEEDDLEEIQMFYGAQQHAAQAARVYNTDRTDTDLDSFSEAVMNGKKKSLTGLAVTALLLAAGVIVVIIWWILRYGRMIL